MFFLQHPKYLQPNRLHQIPYVFSYFFCLMGCNSSQCDHGKLVIKSPALSQISHRAYWHESPSEHASLQRSSLSLSLSLSRVPSGTFGALETSQDDLVRL